MHHSRYLVILIVVATAVAAPGVAQAGSYSVSGTCGLWSPFSNNSARVAVYAEAGCNGLTARNSVGSYRSPRGTEGGWRLTAPGGSTITRLAMHAYLLGNNGWDAVIFDNGGGVFVGCPGNRGCENRVSAQPNFNTGANAAEITARVRCYGSSCPNSGDLLHGQLQIASSSVTITDYTAPVASITGGTAASGGWKRGTTTMTINASDNVGVAQYEAYADGNLIGVTPRSDCSFVGRLVPCPNGAGTIAVKLGELADGRHSLTGRAIDSAGNAGVSAARAISVDNHAPVSVQNPRVDGGTGWRTSRTRAVRWTNPSREIRANRAGALRAVPGGGR